MRHAAILITALLGGHLIRRPVERLLVVADRWRAGDLTARSGLRVDGSEFGRLGEYQNIVFIYLGKSAQHGKYAVFFAGLVAQQALFQLDHSGNMSRQNAQLTLKRGDGDEVGFLVGERGPRLGA